MLSAVEPLARAQEFLRVDRPAAHPRLVVQVRAGGAPGRADLADDLPGPDRLADAHVDRGEVAVAGGQAVAMVDVDHPAIAAAPARRRHLAVGGGAHRIAGLAVQIEPGMHGGRAGERVHAHAEPGRRIDVAVDRLAHGNAADGSVPGARSVRARS